MKLFVLVLLCGIEKVSSLAEEIINVDELFQLYSFQFTNVSQKCQRDSNLYYEDARDNKNSWGLKMFDASAKMDAGLLTKNFLNLGSYDECVKISIETPNDIILGQYCLVTFKTPNLIFENTYKKYYSEKRLFGSFKILEHFSNDISVQPSTVWGFCLPQECTSTDLKSYLQNILGYMNFTGYVDQIDCQLESSLEFPFDNFDWFITILFLLMGSVVAASTIMEFVLIYIKHEIGVPKFLMFSWLTNGRELFSISENPNQITCLNGIKVLSLFWLIASSEYSVVYNIAYVSNFEDILKTPNKYLQIFSSPYIGLDDISFLLSSCLLMYNFMREYEKSKKINFLKCYMSRFIRLTAPLLPLILISVSILANMGSGPFWKDIISPMVNNCKKNWWASLFFLDEFTERDSCIKDSWFLTAIMHLYCISPIFLIPMMRWPFCTSYLLGTTIIVFTAIQIFIVDFWEVDIGNFGIDNQISSFGFRLYHTQFYTRVALWSSGLQLGYFLHKRRKEMFKNSYISKTVKVVMWILSFFCLSIPFLMHLPAVNSKYVYSRVYNDIFLGIYRLLWSFGLSWIIFACAQGYAGIINSFLSLPIFEVLGKLTYSMYLIHYFIILMKYGVARYPVYWTHINMLFNISGTIIITAIVSVAWYLTFELPLIKLSKKKLK